MSSRRLRRVEESWDLSDAELGRARRRAVVVSCLEAQLSATGNLSGETSAATEQLAQRALAVAHELNNILTVIRTYTHFSRQASDPDRRARDLRVVAAAAERGTVFTDWLGSIAKERPRAPSATSGRGLLSTLALRLQVLTTPGTTIDIVPSTEDLYFLTDQSRVEHVLSSWVLSANLALAGARFTLAFERTRGAQAAERGVFIVTCCAAALGPNGASATEQLASLTEILGEILATMNGSLRLAVTEPEGLIRFEVELPVAGSARSPHVSPFPALERQRGTALVVEDDAAIRFAMQRTLSDAEFRVLEVSDGPAAQLLMSELGLTVDLVVSDLVLPRGSGLDLLAWLKVSHPNTALLLISGRDREGAGKARELGVHFLGKPFYPAELLTAVRVAIAASGAGVRREWSGALRPVVLIVDDDADIRESLDRLLRECDFETHVAKSGIQALRILSEHRVDAIVSDQFMPGLNGIALLELVQDRYPECTRILCTGRPASDVVLDAVNRGRVHRVLAKTMHAVALRDEIERAVLGAHRTPDGTAAKEPGSAGGA